MASAFAQPGLASHILGGDEECDVTTGDSIQAAVDNADPYTTIVVCEATYHQTVTLNKDGIQLLAEGTPILDGSLLTGTRYGIQIAEGVRDVVIHGFEIRDYDDSLDSDDPSSGIVALGTTYNITIRGNDIYDNAWTGLVFATGTAVAWELEDATSGLTNVSIRQFNATAVEVASPVFLEPGADTDPVQASALLNLSAIPHGEQLTVQVRGVDRAGNENTTWHNTTRDLLAPSLDGFIDGLDEENTFWANTPEHRDPILDTVTQAGDGVSGLDLLEVVVYNQTSNVEEGSWLVDLDGNASAWSNQSFQGYPNATYSLNATAWDTAGNENTTTLATAQVQVFPAVDPRIPNALYQWLVSDLPIRGATNATSHFTGLALSEVNLTVTNQTSGETRLAHDDPDNHGPLSAYWNTADELEGSYQVSYQARLHRALVWVNMTVNLTHPDSGGFPELAPGGDTWDRGYGSVNGTGDADVWSLTYEGSCSDRFTVWLHSPDGHDLELYLTEAAPGQAGTDTGNYTRKATTTSVSSTVSISWEGPAPGGLFSVLVRNATGVDAPYSMTYSSHCSSGGGGGGGGGGDTGDGLLEQVRKEEPKTN